jgi:hypothetical protein
MLSPSYGWIRDIGGRCRHAKILLGGIRVRNALVGWFLLLILLSLNNNIIPIAASIRTYTSVLH